MATLAAIQKQIAELERQAESIRRSEAAAAAAKAKELIVRFGLTAADLGLVGKAATASSRKNAKATKAGRQAPTPKPAGVPKYQDPKSGKTWTGVGKPPAWIAGKKDRDAFLMTPVAAAPAAETAMASAARKPVVARKAATAKPAKPAAEVPAAPAKRAMAKKAAALAAAPETAARAATAKKASPSKRAARKATAAPAVKLGSTDSIAGGTAEAIVATA